jgi:hypothetical protein
MTMIPITLIVVASAADHHAKLNSFGPAIVMTKSPNSIIFQFIVVTNMYNWNPKSFNSVSSDEGYFGNPLIFNSLVPVYPVREQNDSEVQKFHLVKSRQDNSEGGKFH